MIKIEEVIEKHTTNCARMMCQKLFIISFRLFDCYCAVKTIRRKIQKIKKKISINSKSTIFMAFEKYTKHL